MHDSFIERFPVLGALQTAELRYHVETAVHSGRVGRLAGAVGARLDLSDHEVESLRWGGMLHDLGKLAVPCGILEKSGPLTADEWEEIHRHPGVGAEVIYALSPELRDMALAVRAHHERWDGTGYPDGLCEEGIPLAGRILAMVDVYDAVTFPRAYRSGVLSRDDALMLLMEGSGSLFDPGLVPLAIDVLRREDRRDDPWAAAMQAAQPAPELVPAGAGPDPTGADWFC